MIAKSTSQNLANFNYLPIFSGQFFKTHWLLQKKPTFYWVKPADDLPSFIEHRENSDDLAGSTTRSCWCWKLQRKACQESVIKLHISNQVFGPRNFGDHWFGESFHFFLFAIVAKTWNGKKQVGNIAHQTCGPWYETMKSWLWFDVWSLKIVWIPGRIYPIHQARK